MLEVPLGGATEHTDVSLIPGGKKNSSRAICEVPVVVFSLRWNALPAQLPAWVNK